MILNSKTWPFYSKIIASSADPTDYSPAACDRLMDALGDYVVNVKGVHPQFKAHNKIQVIDFRDGHSRKRYEAAYENFLQEKARIEAKREEGTFGGNAGLQILVQLLKFRMAAELEKVPDICERMIAAVNNEGKAAVCAFNFKQSIAHSIKYLVDAGVPRDQISLIWGGGNSSVSAKKKKKLDLKKKITENKALMDLFSDADIDMADIGLEYLSESATVVIDDSLGLGPQSQKERQHEIDKFQKGKSLYCFFTLKSGGVGLSLHHTDELTNRWKEKTGFLDWKKIIDDYNKNKPDNHKVFPGKTRKKDSGYSVEEDIPFIPTRPRKLFGATTYSAIEMVQMLGRCARLTSLSDTEQIILFYKGTIEERVAWIVSTKLRCLRKVVRQKESWEDVIMGGYTQDDKDLTEDMKEGQEAIKNTEMGEAEEDSTSILFGDESTEDEESEEEEKK